VITVFHRTFKVLFQPQTIRKPWVRNRFAFCWQLLCGRVCQKYVFRVNEPADGSLCWKRQLPADLTLCNPDSMVLSGHSNLISNPVKVLQSIKPKWRVLESNFSVLQRKWSTRTHHFRVILDFRGSPRIIEQTFKGEWIQNGFQRAIWRWLSSASKWLWLRQCLNSSHIWQHFAAGNSFQSIPFPDSR
jgi:hypothetical protein